MCSGYKYLHIFAFVVGQNKNLGSYYDAHYVRDDYMK
jgi:hypothetical protein